ncbi:MAG TPA: zinc metallopeptidase [Planctomycetota bacterium]|nr:zinc metallopeptidase [Planctomycetota bacterium]
MTTLWILSLLLMGVSLWASFAVKGTFARYNRTPIRSGMSGAEAAAAILRAAGIHDVGIVGVPGMLADHYDPNRRVVGLSQEVLHGRTPAAVAVAAHEVGHALQHAQAYAPMQIRAGLVPIANFANGLAMPLILLGLITHATGFLWLGIIGFSFGVLFHVVTLPVEFDASRRAMQILERSGIVAPDEMPGVRKTLYAAGFTYLAGALFAIVELLRLLALAGVFGNSEE